MISAPKLIEAVRTLERLLVLAFSLFSCLGCPLKPSQVSSRSPKGRDCQAASAGDGPVVVASVSLHLSALLR